MVNKHNLVMRNLRKAAGYTKVINNGRVQIDYDMASGDILYTWHLSSNEWTEYNNADIIHIVTTRKPMTMQDIADAIHDKVTEYKAIARM